VAFDAPELSWTGHGYFDCNDGDVPLAEDFGSWHWSRAATPAGARILYDVTRRDGSLYGLALDVDAAGIARRFSPPPLQKLPATGWGVRRMTRADLGAEVRQIRGFESAPFYARSLLATQINGEKLHSVHESLDLRRFAKPWVKMLLPFRMPRLG
jgi:carotenoid 1,2-hydratase